MSNADAIGMVDPKLFAKVRASGGRVVPLARPEESAPPPTDGVIRFHGNPEDRLDRHRAAIYLTAIGLPVAPFTLKSWSLRNRGPAYLKQANGRVRYRRKDLNDWAAKQVTRCEPEG